MLAWAQVELTRYLNVELICVWVVACAVCFDAVFYVFWFLVVVL